LCTVTKLAGFASACLLAGLAGCEERPVTFNRDIAPILFAECAPCHHPGEAAPFSLLSYRDAKARARLIADVTRTRYMPPWLPESGDQRFAGELRLTESQIALIQKWAAQGAQEGDRKLLPQMPHFEQGWQLGRPDLIVQMPRPYTLAAEGSDVFRNFPISLPIGETRYVKALEIRPGNKRVVHHANILVDRSGRARRLEGRDGAPGYDGMSLDVESEVFDPDSHFLFWKPGTVASFEPEGQAWSVSNGTDLILNMHLQPSGKPESIQAAIGLYFTPEKPSQHPMLIQLEHDAALDIAPGLKDFEVTDELRLPVDVDVLAVYPHAHYLGKDLQAYATLPDGRVTRLIRIKRWNLNWQAVYRYVEPVFLPKGSVVAMKYTYDNSADNVSNPNHPPKRVRNGNRSSDEMGHLWLQVLARGTDDGRNALQDAFMRRRLEKDPNDFSARFNLGALLQSQGKLDEAEKQYRAAIALRPGDYTTLNSLGSLFELEGKPDEAIAFYEKAVEGGDYRDARYNLANSLVKKGELVRAAQAYRLVLRLAPDDQAARERLCAVLRVLGDSFAEAGKPADAARIFGELAGLQPDDAEARNNLGSALARQGHITEAAAEFRTALRINPGLAAARENLDRVRGLHSSKE
jgi:tetratricopeptide (TPR) repeat protein